MVLPAFPLLASHLGEPLVARTVETARRVGQGRPLLAFPGVDRSRWLGYPPRLVAQYVPRHPFYHLAKALPFTQLQPA